MKRAPLPANEEARLAALVRAGLLDTLPEPAFDDLTRLAAVICGAPIALVSLVDAERLWLKSRVGVESAEVSRDVAFCAHTILQREPLVVPDLRADERFADNPLVLDDPRVRFYAGVPLRTAEDHALGSLCVIDRVPRALSPEQLEALAALARQVVAQIELRIRAAEVTRVNEELALAARRFRESEARSRALMAAIPDALLRVGRGGVVRDWEPSSDFALFAEREVIGRPLRELLPAPTGELLARAADEAINEGAARVFEFAVPEGGDREARVVPGGDDEALAIVRDISARMAVDRLKNEFVSTVSHELRTPLTSIRGALGLLEGGVVGELPPEAGEIVQIARSNCDRLIRLINDILDLEKMEAGRVELAIAEVAAADLVRTAIAGLGAVADAAGIRVEPAIDEAWRVRVDPDRLVQVITNLIANAIKFSPPGSRVAVRAERGALGRLRFEIADEGPGIPPSQRHRLFGKFQQLDGSDTRQKGGSGLGLAISKAIVELHGGAIGVAGGEPGGAVFWFEVPTALGASLPPAGPVSEARASSAIGARHDATARVLIVDDDRSFRAVLAARLRSMGFDCVEAADGAEALHAARQGAFALIILDVGMPRPDGFEVIDILRAEGTAATPLIVYSGRDLSADDRRALTLGATRYLTKARATEADFIHAVRELLGDAAEEGSS